MTLTSRTALLQVISFVGTFLLTIFLSPEVFGVFFVITAIVAFLNYFSDIGLAAALIQKKEEVTDTDLKTTFTIQQTLVGLIVLGALLASSKLVQFYNLSSDGAWLFRSLVLAFFLSSLKTIPSVILERKLEFNRLVIPQIIEVVFFYLTAVYLAWQGWGIKSFSLAVILRGLSGLVTIYLLQPWLPGFSFNRKVARRLLSFGVPFQLNSFLGLVKDDLFTLYLGKILPFTQVGYIGWAKKWSEVPLRLIMDSIVKVTFPTFSRLQTFPRKLTLAIDKALFFLTLFIFPMAAGLIFAVQPLVFLIPKYLKWQPALPSFFLFVIASLLASLSTPLTNALNGIGKIKVTLKLMIMWTVLTWTLAPILIFLIGFHGVALAGALMGTTTILVIIISRQYFRFTLWENIGPSLLASLVMVIYLWFIRDISYKSLVALSFSILSASLVYFLTLFLFFKAKIVKEIKEVYLIVKDRG